MQNAKVKNSIIISHCEEQSDEAISFISYCHSVIASLPKRRGDEAIPKMNFKE